MQKKYHSLTFIALVATTLLLCGCSTKKNTFTRRAFHNLTSHYNVYWNGQYSLNEGDEQLKSAVKDDYTKILRVYNYGTKTEAMALNAKMDRSLQKTSICVQKHSMKFNGKERVKWIDDAYLVMGKAHFYKQDYIPAKRTFDFICTEFGNNDIALVANLWLVKTYIQTEQYAKAIAAIELLQTKTAGMKKVPKELLHHLDLTIADYYIATKDYRKAIDYLKSGMLETNDRELRLRSMFILGQIYMQLGDANHAIEWFRKVVRKNPKYEMLFEAKMNMARMGSAGNAKEMYKMLDRMLAESKNDDYVDRIYYAMGELAMREGNVDKAIGYFRKSVANARANQNQRAISSLKVATILFDRNNYELSQAYYDTAVRAMTKETFPEYDSIANISRTLNELVVNLAVIRDQDSLLMVVNMDSVSRIKLIDKVIEQVIEEERLAKEREEYEEQLALMGAAVGKTDVQLEDPKASGSWYFYNPTTLQSGFSEFSKKWGMRKLEDNWRISDKRNINNGLSDGGFGAGEEGKENDSTSAVVTNHDRAYYLENLPFTEEQQTESHKMIANALYNVGFIYLDRLSDYSRSIEAYERLDSRYPGNEHELPAWYALYKMHNDVANTVKSDLYKSKILSKYPESSYAKFILDPNYYKKIEEESKQASELYTKTYDAYQQGQYYRVRMNAERALELYANDTALAPRFALLDAVARGRLETVDSMAYALLRVVQDYPASGVRNYAVDLLREVNEEYHLGLKLDKLIGNMDEDTSDSKQESPYKYDPRSSHFVMVVFNPKAVKTEPLKVRISDFNRKQYRFSSFDTKTLLLDDTQAVIYLSSFGNEEDARNYITSMFLNDYIFGGMDKNTYWVLPISVSNFGIFCNEKKIDEYKTFLDENSK